MTDKTELDQQRSLQVPWWGHILLAVLIYTGCKYILPNSLSQVSSLQDLANITPIFAPIGAIVFLLLAANALYRSDQKKEEPEDSSSEKTLDDKDVKSE